MPASQRTARQRRLRRLVAVLVGIELALLLVGAALYSAGVRPWEGDGKLRGSTPPAGQHLPDLSRIDGIAPLVPSPRALRGRGPVVVVATCIDCPEGELLGGFLRRLGTDGFADTQLLVVGWDGNMKRWARAWDVPAAWKLHEVDQAHAAVAQDALHAADTSLLLVYDRRLRWRTTYHLGLLDAEDVRHDVGAVR